MDNPQRPTDRWPRSGRGSDDGNLFAASAGPESDRPYGDHTGWDDTGRDGTDPRWADIRDDESTRTDVAGPGVEELLTRLATAEQAREIAEHALEETRRHADALAAALEDARAHPPETFGMRADKVLRMAEHDAAQRRRAAEAEAEALVERARGDAERITAEARTEAAGITAGAQADVHRLRAAGAEARRDSELVADTAASMHAHVSDLRSTVRDEVARLHALLGAELGRLDGPARVLRRAGAGHVVGSPGTGAEARWAGSPAEIPATGTTAAGSTATGTTASGITAAEVPAADRDESTNRDAEGAAESAAGQQAGAAAPGTGSATPIVLPEQRAADRPVPDTATGGPDAATGDPDTAEAPEHAEIPGHPGNPEHSENPEHLGEPGHAGEPEHAGSPDGADQDVAGGVRGAAGG